jgi:hypothetical protein
MLALVGAQIEVECCVCLEVCPESNQCKRCGGTYCELCISHWISIAAAPTCPLCRYELPCTAVNNSAREDESLQLAETGEVDDPHHNDTSSTHLASSVAHDGRGTFAVEILVELDWMRVRSSVLAQQAYSNLSPSLRSYSLAADAQRLIFTQAFQLSTQVTNADSLSDLLIRSINYFVFSATAVLDSVEQAVLADMPPVFIVHTIH